MVTVIQLNRLVPVVPGGPPAHHIVPTHPHVIGFRLEQAVRPAHQARGFTGGQALAETGIALGHHVSFSGILTFGKADELRAVAARLPADRILVETDAPYLAPTPHRGKRNEPSYVRETARRLAETRGVSEDEIARTTRANTLALFGRMTLAGDPGLAG